MVSQRRSRSLFFAAISLVAMALSGCPVESDAPPPRNAPAKPAAAPAAAEEPRNTAPLETPPVSKDKPAPAAPSADLIVPQPLAPRVPKEPAGESMEEPAEPKPVDLGDPLVDTLDQLKRLDPQRPLWLDAAKKQVVMVGQVVQTNVPLEMLVCLKNTKEHEAVLSVDVKAFAVHAALMALGVQPGTPVQYSPEYKPATGPEIEVTLKWKGDDGKTHTVRGQDWVRNMTTGKAMDAPWIFAGSRFYVNEDSKTEIYMAEGGDFICVSNFPSAMLDLPVASPQDNSKLMFEAFTDRIPSRGTPVTVILSPKSEGT